MRRALRAVLVTVCAIGGALLVGTVRPRAISADADQDDNDQRVSRVLLVSIDGMHAADFANCMTGLPGVNSGRPYCPALAALAEHGLNYPQASASKPSDSFPGILAMTTGGSPRTTGVFYDVSYDRKLSPPNAVAPSACPSTEGTQVIFDESIDRDLTKLNAGGGIDTDALPRDGANACAPVYPHTFLRVNTIFEVVRAAGGYTAWSDKHPAYEILNGPSGTGVLDLYTPEIQSTPVPLPQIPGCSPLPDQTAVTTDDDWTTSFENIKCYDSLKVQAVINEINGRSHDGLSAKPVPRMFGMNFQAVSVGQKLKEHKTDPGGYLDSLGTPSNHLLGEIMFVDGAIGRMVEALRTRGLLDSTLIVISAKHGQSPVDPKRLLRIDFDDPSSIAPSDLLGGIGPTNPLAQAIEDDVSLMWLNNQQNTEAFVDQLEANEARIGGGKIFSGNALRLMFGDPLEDSRTPDIIVAPNVGVVYTGKNKKIAEHGGFAHDDTNVMLLVSNPRLRARTIISPVETAQIAPTILEALGLDGRELMAVRLEGTTPLPGVLR